ncbi:hypothetical protein N9Y42_00110 [Mariniblastus sp.]|nr:hypothetical protein [Mariniblastus sp.]
MNESTPNRKLPSSVQARKEEMLASLQGELASFHRRRKRKRIFASSVAVCVAILVAGFALLDFDTAENSIRPTELAKQRIRQEQPTAVTPPSYAFISTVGSNPGVLEKYVVRNSPTILALEIVDDDEFLKMLAANGKPSIWGRINGELRLIPCSRPTTN